MSVIVTVVVPESPPICPPMSFAWITTKYSSLASLSMLGRAVLIIAAIMVGKKKSDTDPNSVLQLFL